jgi:hypothetical protein
VYDPDAWLRRWRMNSPMMRRGFVAGIACAVAGILRASTLLAAPKTYKYRCPKCKLIQEYGTMGSKKCPTDGWTMIRMN